MNTKKEYFKIVYFPLEQKFTVWKYNESPYKAICLNGYESQNWLETRREAQIFLKDYKSKQKKK